MYYYVNSGNKMRSDDVTKESASVNIKDKGNKELAEALIDPEGGVLAAGLQPEVQAATEEGQKNLLEALHAASVQKPKKGKNQVEKTEKAVPQTLDESMAQSDFKKMQTPFKKKTWVVDVLYHLYHDHSDSKLWMSPWVTPRKVSMMYYAVTSCWSAY